MGKKRMMGDRRNRRLLMSQEREKQNTGKERADMKVGKKSH